MCQNDKPIILKVSFDVLCLNPGLSYVCLCLADSIDHNFSQSHPNIENGKNCAKYNIENYKNCVKDHKRFMKIKMISNDFSGGFSVKRGTHFHKRYRVVMCIVIFWAGAFLYLKAPSLWSVIQNFAFVNILLNKKSVM